MTSRTGITWRTRTSRRRLLASGATGGIGLATAALIGCGGDDDDDDDDDDQGTIAPGAQATPIRTPDAAKPVRGGELKLAVSSQVGTMHPQQAGGSEQVRYNTYDHLILWDYNNDKPDFIAAESYETPEPTRLIYHIRPNANWQDIAPLNGRTVTSTDIDTSWSNYIADTKATGATTIHKVLTDHRETPDQKTLVQVFKKPSVPIFGPHGIAGPIPSTFAPPELWASGELGSKAIGSGAYTVEKFDGASEIRLIRRADSWNGLERPFIDKITYRVITDETARAAALRAEQIDTLAARDKIQADEFKGYSPDILIDKDINFPRVLLMHTGKAPFSDPRIRKAIYTGLDIEDLIGRVDLGEGQYSAFVPPHLAADALPEAEVRNFFPNDKKAARELLTAAGYDFEQEIEFKYPSDSTTTILVETLQQQLLQIGIKTKLIPEDPTTVWSAQTMSKLDYTLTASGLYVRGQDADSWLSLNYKLGLGNGNRNAWSNAETDALFEKSRVEFNAEARHEMLLDLQRKLFEAAAPWINLYAPNLFVARWKRYHPVRDTGYAGTLGHYHWLSA